MKIAKTIYNPFQNGHFLPVMTVSTFGNNFQRKIAEIIPDTGYRFIQGLA
jgi:hypothetical protein